MKLVSIFTSFILSSFANGVLAGPVPVEASIQNADAYTTIESRDSGIPTLAQAKELIKTPSGFSAYVKKGQPAKDTSVFFTCLSKKDCSALGKWAKEKGLVVVANTWKNPNLQSRGQYKGITNNEWGQFLVALSQYYASVSSGKAYLVFPRSETVPSGHIFRDIEAPAIEKAGQVTEIIWLNQTRILANDTTYDWKTETKAWWTKGQSLPGSTGASGAAATAAEKLVTPCLEMGD